MRLWSLLIITASALSLTACETLGLQGNDGSENGKHETVAAAKAVSDESSTQEEQEIAAVMGGSAATDDEPGVGDADIAPPAPVAASADSEDLPPVDTVLPKAAVADGCPGVEVLPDTKSITYFDDQSGRPMGGITARATLVDIRGGCDYAKDSVIVDIDLIMQGHITDKGRYEGRHDLEAFMTFPYFVAVMDPDGKLIDKKIMATAMRFKPQIDDLDHAEKITQTIPLADVSKGSKYTITLGFQLNRQQLDYNRGTVSGRSSTTPAIVTPTKTVPEDAPAADAAAESDPKTPPKSAETAPEVKPAQAAPKTKAAAPDTTPKSTPAPAPAKSSASRMKPIVE